jgi:tetratricopeptide (TPR) repeat protein
MERWGIDTFFTYVTAQGEYTPEIESRLYYWPFAIDPLVFKNWRYPKTIPVLFMGNSTARQYAWRRRVREKISKRFPTLYDNHLGWDPEASKHALYGQRYSQLINCAWIAPTCGGFTRTLVNKHLEIPASYSLLVTERTPVLESAGFVDGHNCVFADEGDVLEKLEPLFLDLGRMQQMIDAGYQLIQARHLQAHRTQILEWFMLRRRQGPNQVIVQPDPFASLQLIDAGPHKVSPTLISSPEDRMLISAGDTCFLRHEFDGAIRRYEKALEFCPYMPEAIVRLALCDLLRGLPRQACQRLEGLVTGLFQQNALEPEPVEWALLALSYYLAGETEKSVEMLRAVPSLRRLELDRVRWAISKLTRQPDLIAQIHDANLLHRSARERASIHILPYESFKRFMTDVLVMCEVCNLKTESEFLLQEIAHVLTTPLPQKIHQVTEQGLSRPPS